MLGRLLRSGRLATLLLHTSHRLIGGALVPALVHRPQPLIVQTHRAFVASSLKHPGDEDQMPAIKEEWEPPPGFSDWDGDDEPPPMDGSGEISGAPAQSLGAFDDIEIDFDIEDDEPSRPKYQPKKKMESEFAASLEMPQGTCMGCGARFQTEDAAAPGFVPASAYEKKVALVDEESSRPSPAARKAPICQRCHGLRYQNRPPVDSLRVGSEATHDELRPEHFLELLSDIGRTRSVVVAIVDLFDFHGSLVPDLASVVGEDNTLVLACNKMDLLPDSVDVKKLERWVRAEGRKARLPPVHSVHMVSCKSGTGMPKLLEEVKELMTRKRLDAYVVGAANAGKSSFINHVLRSQGVGRDGGRREEVVTSVLPGTTLDFVRVSVLGGRYALYDTPGVILPNQITTRLTTEELSQVVPKKRAQHVTLRVKEGKSVLLGGIARIHVHSGRPYLFTFYLANDVQIHPTDIVKVDEVLQKHAGTMLTPPGSYERMLELGDFDETTFEIKGRGWDEAACDLVLPGLGWVAVTGCGPCTIGVCLPAPVVPLQREPLIASEGGIKGVMRNSYTKYTGTKLRNGKKNTARQPLKTGAKSKKSSRRATA